MGKQESLCPAAAPQGPDPASSAVAALAAGGAAGGAGAVGSPGAAALPEEGAGRGGQSPELVQVAVSVCLSESRC